ncbi:hypothetical protein FRACA_2450009 [Frankia canadensis]|uniref:Epoxide hydrolase N-terminal domain-containing protein n=1 Tax=Frankia canadensis TaxID=1836972 RepID=A0A2I2KRV6_9ACTN|nr:hypothetical protein FRACA_2450009 [Frankia canadensis]SOU55685.1 hypothetical protein FRACA_2450009 [Frankia canadensis]
MRPIVVRCAESSVVVSPRCHSMVPLSGGGRPMIEDPTPFTVAVEDRALRDLRDRLLRARLPTGDAVEDPRFGLTASALREFLEYWLDEYDWRAEEAAINALPNSTAVLDGRPVHFVPPARDRPPPDAARAHTRLPLEFLGLPEGDRPADRSGGLRRRPGGRFPRRRTIAARILLLGTAAAPRLQRPPGGGAVGAPDARHARVRAVRRRRRRLGIGRVDRARPRASRRAARRLRHAAELLSRTAQPLRSLHPRRPRARGARLVRVDLPPQAAGRPDLPATDRPELPRPAHRGLRRCRQPTRDPRGFTAHVTAHASGPREESCVMFVAGVGRVRPVCRSCATWW